MSSYSFRGRTRLWKPRDEEENRVIFSSMRQDTGISMPDNFQPIYIENEEFEVEKWSAKQLIRLLRLYGSHPCLWDLGDAFNRNRLMRKAAMIDITTAMGDDVTMETIAQKINVVRSTYRYEKRRIKQRIRKGLGAKTKLKWFALADSFLRHVPRLERNKKDDSDSDLEDAVVFTIDPEILIPLEEDNSGTQNCISIGSSIDGEDNKPEDNPEVTEQMQEINEMLENYVEKDLWLWRTKEATAFIKLYRKFTCLWDKSHPLYKNRTNRRRVISELAQSLEDHPTDSQVIRKISALRSMYRMERKRFAEGYAKGKVVKSRLKWYPLADSFLRQICHWKDIYPVRIHTVSDGEADGNSAEQSNESKLVCSTLVNESIQAPELNIEAKSEPISDDETFEAVHTRMNRPWTSTESMQLVDLLSIHDCLWDTQHPHYRKAKERSKAVEDIAFKMDMPESRIWKKLKIILKTYQAETRRREQANQMGTVFESNYIWFNPADEFLKRRIEMPSSTIPMSFVDPDLMSPAPAYFQYPADAEKIKQEIPESPHDDLMDHSFDSPAPSTPAPVTPAPLPPTEFSRNEGITSECKDWKFNMLTPVKAEKESEDNCPKNDPNNIPTKVIWNGLEDDLLEGKWSLKHSVKFLRLYGAHRCLWDLKDPDYRNRELRNAAMTDIAAAMGHGLNIDYVAKKIKILRITYMQHRKRMLEAYKAGQEPEIQLRWFPLADSFLRPHIGLRCIKPGEVEMPQFDFQFVCANLNLIDPGLLNDFQGKGTQNSIQIGDTEENE